MTSGIATSRLREERKAWRKDHPVNFYARPVNKGDGSTDMMKWTAGIPGKEGTDWEKGTYTVTLEFSQDYPSKPPKCKFTPPIFHPNVYTSGNICLDIINEGEGWRPAITIKQILLGIQELLDNPNPLSPANGQAERLFSQNKQQYKRRVQQEAMRFAKK